LSLCNLEWIVWIVVNEKWGGIQANGISVFFLSSRIRLEDPLVTAKTDSCINLPLYAHEIFVRITNDDLKELLFATHKIYSLPK